MPLHNKAVTVATAPTVYGIETPETNSMFKSSLVKLEQHLPSTVLKLAKSYPFSFNPFTLQQHLPFTVCDAGCETAEEQSDDEVRTSQVPERSEGKTKLIRQ